MESRYGQDCKACDIVRRQVKDKADEEVNYYREHMNTPNEDYEELPDLVVNYEELPELVVNHEDYQKKLPDLTAENYQEELPELVAKRALPDLLPEFKDREAVDVSLKKLKLSDNQDCFCDCRKEEMEDFEANKQYTLSYLHHLMEHQLKLFEETNKFIANVKKTDTSCYNRRHLRKLKMQNDIMIDHLKSISNL